MKKRGPFLIFVFLFFGLFSRLYAQTEPEDPAMTSTQFDTSGFPQWARDLRRAEIVAFGSFPFTYFFTNFGFDTYRSAVHGWDRRYAPWPIQSAGGIEKSQREKIMTLGIAAGASILIAVIDYSIVRHKRNREQREIGNLPPGTPIIIRKPLNGEEDNKNTPQTTPSQTEAENP